MSKFKKGAIPVVAVLAGFGALAVLLAIGRVEGAKPAPVTPISLKAELATTWIGTAGVPVETRIRADNDGQIYTDMTDTKKIKYGSTVKYYPAGAWDPRGQFIMKIDRAGILGRFVRMRFGPSATGPNCVSAQAGCDVDGFIGETGDVETATISLSTQILLVENGGQLVRSVDAPIGMESMKAGDRKIVGLGLSFTPDDPDFDYQYDLGQFTDPENYDPEATCQEQNYPWGAAELVCLATGQIWEFRPLNIAYDNEPDNLFRLLWGRVLLGYWTFCRLGKWEMPFVLRVSR